MGMKVELSNVHSGTSVIIEMLSLMAFFSILNSKCLWALYSIGIELKLTVRQSPSNHVIPSYGSTPGGIIWLICNSDSREHCTNLRVFLWDIPHNWRNAPLDSDSRGGQFLLIRRGVLWQNAPLESVKNSLWEQWLWGKAFCHLIYIAYIRALKLAKHASLWSQSITKKKKKKKKALQRKPNGSADTETRYHV